MVSFLQKMLGNKPKASKDDAKNRLKVLLIHDQVDLTQAQMEAMKAELLEVVQRYVEVDTEEMEFKLHREDGQIALVSNLPVRRVNVRAAS